MDISAKREYDLYNDIQSRCGGEIYIGVVGPVRTGKSTFIKRFMDLMVLPNMVESYEKERAVDELPQSAGGKTITTTEPKFIPKEAAKLSLGDGIEARVRLIDCVGYMVEGASGHMEDDAERMVKTPWYAEEIPFTQAAEIGTRKVINDHSTIGIVITCDGSFGDIPRENYLAAEERTIKELKKLKKPFVVILNTAKPYGEEAARQAREIENQYGVSVMPVNCEQLKKEDIHQILENILYEFPLTMIEFYMPKWVEMLPANHKMKVDLIGRVREIMQQYNCIRDVKNNPVTLEGPFIKKCKMDSIDMADGCIKVWLDVDDAYYYEMLSDMVGENIDNEYHLLSVLKEMARMKKEYVKVLHAIDSVRQKGYGVVTPERDEIRLDKPEVIRHGNKFGVKIRAESPSIHMIRANIETEISPIVGSEEQAQDLIRFISDSSQSEAGIWETNIFGKSVEQLVNDGITGKLTMIGDESQLKLQETMQKIVNDSNGGMVCIII
ncbi:MAG: stage IV sporulation protein A [Lachnospiraceae bacterium]|jgi:stage IV sporulation protein A|nr:stage IV sporulation protein A [Lachnospiraceae bacterium]MCI9096000.1 stage IV sporulation protein A [Lachnospiraceae bacterium]MCI9202298.1 stage IV sporulation protein A [Lachnospiraceae bacterium]MCI9335663.1 stage IV sporulation protein A [Lachnospiraceae bacterium]